MKAAERNEALKAGDKYYFTGKPCKRGHIAKRFVSSFECIECSQRASKKEKKAIYDANRYAEIAPIVRDRVGSWGQENPEKVRANKRRWESRNPLAIIKRSSARRARERESAGAYRTDDVLDLLRIQRNECAICECSIACGYHVDHIIPLARGGTNWCGNLQLLCAKCNQQKSDKIPVKHRMDRMKSFSRNDSSNSNMVSG